MWALIVGTILTGSFLGTKAVVPSMRRAGGGVIVNLGSLAARLGDTARAIRVLAHAAGTAPRDVEVRFNLGLLYWRTGRSADARREWEAVIREAPASDLARNARAALSGKGI